MHHLPGRILAGEVPPMGAAEQERLAREADLAPDIRLSCQIRVESDLEVRVINRSQQSGIPAGPRPHGLIRREPGRGRSLDRSPAIAPTTV